jgi:FSR family fosmidomycin resistance protein-like MFS transporter
LAQSLFQVGGNIGSSIGPLVAAFVIARRGQASIAWFCLVALTGIFVLSRVGRWYRKHLSEARAKVAPRSPSTAAAVPRNTVVFSIAILIALIFSKYFYLVSLTSYYTFYLIGKFHVSVEHAQILLFVFLFAVAAGTFAGGPLGDRFGRKYVIWFSILGVAPFSLALPYANLFWTVLLTVLIGLILASAFSAILVYAQELVPGKVGLIAGLFFGFAFGVGGIASAALGRLADHTSIDFVFKFCAYLPLIGLLTGFLPDLEKHRSART